ncbi:hypothetical protein V6N13_120738 [Hibiscus sabdariffa]
MSRNTASSPLLDQQSSDIGDEGKTLHLLDEETGTLKRQTENNYKDSDSDSDTDTDYGSDDGIEITDEQLKIYGDALAASGGFDVPYFPRVVACCLITPIRINTFFREDLKPYCVAGMNHFNQDKKTNYEFVRLLKATHQDCKGILYYLTFEGRTPENITKIFEAQVHDGIPKNKGDYTIKVADFLAYVSVSRTDNFIAWW